MRIDPGDCAAKIIDIHGEKGVKWLEKLPAIIEKCAERWSLTILPPYSALSYNYVTPAIRQDGTRVVLKAGVPSNEIIREIEALRRFDGGGIAMLIEADADEGVLLLERLMPGEPLSCLTDDEKATEIAARVMRSLWKPAPSQHCFPTLGDWARELKNLRTHYSGGCGPFPEAMVDKAEHLFGELLASMTEPMLIHGDFHHDNILSSERESWLAIDPKGVVGEPEYDVAYFCLANNLMQQAQPKETLARRLDQSSADLGLDRSRMIKWGFALSILTGWWSVEDHGEGQEKAIAQARLVEELM